MTIDDFLKQLKEKNYAPDTIRTYRRLSRYFQNIGIDAHTIQSYQQHIQSLKPTSQKNYLSALKKMVRTLNPELENRIVIPKIPKQLAKAVPDQTELARILEKPDLTKFNGIRNRAILELLYSTGIRRSELTHLKLDDIDFAKQVLRINQGKMKKDRLLPISSRAIDWLKRYLDRVRPGLKPHCSYVFLSRSGYQMHEGTPNKIVREYSNLSPHMYRHACATHLMQNGMKETSLQRILGHAQVSTTQVYTKVTVRDLKASYTKFFKREKFSDVKAA